MTGRGGPQRIPRPPGVVEAGPPPWAHLDPERRRLTVADVRRAFADNPPVAISEHEGQHLGSAVLAAMYDRDDEAHVILTRRAWHLRAHKGEVSFPGGRRHADETPHEAALREAWEEVALPPDAVEVVGELDHRSTISSRSYIVPVVGVLPEPPTDLVPEPGEVEHILEVPLSELLDPAHFRAERWEVAALRGPIYFFELVGDTVWGATAAMLVDLLSRLTGTRAEPGL